MTFSVQRPFWRCNFWFSINKVRLKGNTHTQDYLQARKELLNYITQEFNKKMLDEQKIHWQQAPTPCVYFCQNMQKAPQPYLLLSLRQVVQQISPLEAIKR